MNGDIPTSFWAKHAARSQLIVGQRYLQTSLDLLSEEKGRVDWDHCLSLACRWDVLTAKHEILRPMSRRFSRSLSPKFILEAHEFCEDAKLLLQNTMSKTRKQETDKASKARKRIGVPVAKPKTSTASKPDPSNAAIKQSPISPSVEGSALGASDDNEDDSTSALSLEHFPKDIVIIPINRRQFNASPVAGGGYSDVWRCDWIDNGKKRKVAVKIMRRDNYSSVEETMKRRLYREVRIWQSLQHPHIVPFHGVCHTFDSLPGIVSSWMSNGQLLRYLDRRSPNITTLDRLSLLCQAASGLQYLHERDPPIVHGDLKSGNVLVDGRGNVCLADFGLSNLLEGVISSVSSRSSGSIRWMAPELFKTGHPRTRRSLETDIYAFSGLMMEVLGGHMPFHTYKNDLWVMMEISQGALPTRPNCAEEHTKCDRRACARIHETHWDYMLRCWSTDAKMRPTISDVRVQLENFKKECVVESGRIDPPLVDAQ